MNATHGNPAPHSVKATDAGRRWSREVALIRARALKCQTRPRVDPFTLDVVDEALKTCDGVLQAIGGYELERDRARAEVESARSRWDQLFAVLPCACLVTDDAGLIADANDAAGGVLNFSARALAGRALLLFTDDRLAYARLMAQARTLAEPVRTQLVLRPRERRPVTAMVTVARAGPDGTQLLWFLGEPTAVTPVAGPRPISLPHRFTRT